MTRVGDPATSNRVRKPAEARRAEIVAEAAAIALRDGLEGVTLRAVAEPLGVRPGLISHYFSAVEGLVVEAFVLAVTAERDWLFGDDDAPLAQMAGFVRRAESPEAVELCRLWLNARHLARAMPSLATAIDEQETLDRVRMVALIEAGVANGDFAADDPVGASTRIYMAVDALGVYANNAAPFEHPALRHFVSDVAEWSLGLPPRTLQAESGR
ncbi:TetR family transcriptional regulator [Leucobacter chromiiresistens]